MKRFGWSLLIVSLTIFSGSLFSCRGHTDGNWVRVTFRVVVSGVLAPLDHPYIASSINGWSPSSPVWKMMPESSNVFTLNIELPEGQNVQYYYTLGDRSCLETVVDGKHQPSRSVMIKEDLVQLDTVSRWSMASLNAGRWLWRDVLIFQAEWFKQRVGQAPTEYFDAQNPLRRLKSVRELDSLLKLVQAEWRQIAQDRYQGVLPELNDNCYVGISGQLDSSFNRAAQEYILEYYQIPAFLREYRDMHSLPLAERVWPLRIAFTTLQFVGDYYWLGINDTLPASEVNFQKERKVRRAEQWQALSAIFWDVSKQLDTVLSDSFKGVDEEDMPGILQVRGILENMEPSWQITDALVCGRTQEAVATFKRLRPYGKTGIGSDTYVRIGSVLMMDLVKGKHSREALDVIDSVFVNATMMYPLNDRSKQEYKKLYVQADPAKGAARYEQTLTRIQLRGTFHYAARRAATPLLSGKFVELMSGDTVDLANLRGKIVVLDFWTTSCGGCVREFPEVKRLAKELSGSQDVAFFSVLDDQLLENIQENKPLKRFIAAHSIDFPVLLETRDYAFRARFGIWFYPSHFVLNRKGEVDLDPNNASNWDQVRMRVATLRAGG
jgi:thiol-disulfide isomerase/thioredoxin